MLRTPFSDRSTASRLVLSRSVPGGDEPAYPVQQLVIGIDAHRVVDAALYDWSDDDGDFIEIARFDGVEV